MEMSRNKELSSFEMYEGQATNSKLKLQPGQCVRQAKTKL